MQGICNLFLTNAAARVTPVMAIKPSITILKISLSYAERIVMKVPRREENRHRLYTTQPILAKIEVSYGRHTLLLCCLCAGYPSHPFPLRARHPSRPTDLQARLLLFLVWDQ